MTLCRHIRDVFITELNSWEALELIASPALRLWKKEEGPRLLLTALHSLGSFMSQPVGDLYRVQ